MNHRCGKCINWARKTAFDSLNGFCWAEKEPTKHPRESTDVYAEECDKFGTLKDEKVEK